MRHSLLKSIKKIIAFTLAEILIAITVIGVVAALTIPALIQSIQEAQFREAFKKYFSDFAKATTTLQSRGELSFAWGQPLTAVQYSKIMNFTKIDSSDNLFAPHYTFYKNATGAGESIVSTNDAAQFANGAVIAFFSGADDCGWNAAGIQHVCRVIVIDVNGKKGPNMYGKDAFRDDIIIFEKNGGYNITTIIDSPWGICTSNATSAYESHCGLYILKNTPLP